MQPNVDLLVGNLQDWARMARRMPRSFDAGAVTYDVGSDQGLIAKLLPGRGVMPLFDLKSLGITKQPAGVYDPSRYRRLEESFEKLAHIVGFDGKGEVIPSVCGAAISTYDQIIANRASGKAQDRAITKLSTATTANIWSSMFAQGGSPAAGVYLATTAPTDRVPIATTTGALTFFNSNPGGTDRFYLLTFGYTAAQQINMAVLVDILNDGGIFRLSVNTAETVTTPTNATREYGPGTGIGNLLTAVVQTAGTPGAGTSIVQYVDQASANTNAPTLTVAATLLVINQLWPSAAAVTAGAGSFFIPLAAASTGVRAVKQHTASVAGTGNLATNVFWPLLFVPGLAASSYIERDSTTQIDGLTELVNVSQQIGCLALYVLPNAATTGVLTAYTKAVTG